MSNHEEGSLAIEATMITALFLLLLTLFFSIIYAYHVQRIAFEKATIYVLEANHEFLGKGDFQEMFSTRLLHVQDDYGFEVFKRVKEGFPYEENGFSHPLEEVVFITDYGKMYHLPSCPTVQKSLRPILKKDVPHLTPCSVCH